MGDTVEQVRRAQAGDAEAYGAIVERYQDMAYGYAYALLGDGHLAQDAVQDAFIEAHEALGKLREPAAFPGWFRRIVLKRCDRLRRGNHRVVRRLEADAEPPAGGPGPLEAALAKEIRSAVLAAIRALPEAERTATALFYINGYSHREIAEFLETPVNTVKSRLHAARERLRGRMLAMVEEDKTWLPETWPAEIRDLANFTGRFPAAVVKDEGGEFAYAGRTADFKKFLDLAMRVAGLELDLYYEEDQYRIAPAPKSGPVPYDWRLFLGRMPQPTGAAVWRGTMIVNRSGRVSPREVGLPAGALRSGPGETVVASRTLGGLRAWMAERVGDYRDVLAENVWRAKEAEGGVSHYDWYQLPRPAGEGVRRGQREMLDSLLAAGTITRQDHEEQMTRLAPEGESAPADPSRGRLDVISNLYHRGRIDTDTFLRLQDEARDEWYRIDNILPNGDFEEGLDRQPVDRLVDLAHWHGLIWGHMDIGRSRVDFDRETKHHGRQSLRFSSDRAPSSIAYMSHAFPVWPNDNLKIRFWVKADRFKRGYYARSAVLYFYKSSGIAMNLVVPEGTYDWMMLEAELDTFGDVPKGKVEPCVLEFQFFGEGTLWLDDMLVVPTIRREVARVKPAAP